tara:strand:- start:5729 stop:6463 length:735 start_codon:yes stop_codon:yes gene_type:complete
MNFKGVIFDLDGVISKTEKVHALAWKKTFDSFLKERSYESGEDFVEFDLVKDYFECLDGKPRKEGIKSFLYKRGVLIEENEESSNEKEFINILGSKKDNIFKKIIDSDGVELYEGSINLINNLYKKKIELYVASSSKNCRKVLKTSGIIKNFNGIFDGIDLEKNNLKGKPEPDIFINVIKNSKLSFFDFLVFEDSKAGIESAKSGGFFVIGVDRLNNPEALKKAGADRVVKDLREIKIDSYFHS